MQGLNTVVMPSVNNIIKENSDWFLAIAILKHKYINSAKDL